LEKASQTADLPEVEPSNEPAIRVEVFDFQTQVAWPCGPLI
jgi:hypothetical protein